MLFYILGVLSGVCFGVALGLMFSRSMLAMASQALLNAQATLANASELQSQIADVQKALRNSLLSQS